MTPVPSTIVHLLAAVTALVAVPTCWLILPILGVSPVHVTGCCVALLGAGGVYAWLVVRGAVL